MSVKNIVSIFLIQILLTSYGYAAPFTPSCLANGRELLVNNEAVIQWKHSTKNQYRNRAHIQGKVVRFFPDHTGHHHYEVQIGGNQNDLIEVIYNEEFGAVPKASIGATFEACGDYITSNATKGHLPASPDGAIVHWVHKSTNLASHDSGYIIVDGILCGQDDSQASGRRHR